MLESKLLDILPWTTTIAKIRHPNPLAQSRTGPFRDTVPVSSMRERGFWQATDKVSWMPFAIYPAMQLRSIKPHTLENSMPKTPLAAC